MRTRRQILALTGVVVLTGCSGGGDNDGDGGDESGGGGGGGGSESTEPPDSDGDGVPDREDDFPQDSDRSVLVGEDSDSLELNEDYYKYFEFDLSESTVLDYEVEVQGDVRIDVILTDDTNFTYFEDDSDWEYFPDGSDFETLSASEEVRLEGGETYYLIVDNTSRGPADPPTNFDNDRVEVDVSYQLYR